MDLSTANVVAFIVNLAAVYASQKGVFGKDNTQVSADHPTLVTPAGWAFSIWGIIFISEFAFVIWQAVTPAGKSDIVARGIGWWFVIACVLQAAWSVAFGQELLSLSAVLLASIAVALALAVVGLAPYKRDVFTLLQTAEGWLVHFPIGLHAGWTCAAALVNINVALESVPISSKIAQLILTVVVACVAAVLAAINYADPVYLCSVVWALAGIAGKSGIRSKWLTTDVALGVDKALAGACVALLAVGAFSVLVPTVY